MTRLPERLLRLAHLNATSQAENERALRDALHLLDEGLCAVCRERDDSARRWLTFFVAESHTDEGVRARVAAAVGFCPAHTRHLLADVSAPWLMPQVCDVALGGGVRLLSAPPGRPAGCPACRAGRDAQERALSTVLRVLDQAQVREAIDGGAVCLPHLATLAARADADEALRIAGTASALLDHRPPEVAWLAAMDPDATRRTDQLSRVDRLLPVERTRQQYAVTDRWDADLEVGCCPLCLAEQRAARRLLRWIATSTGHGEPAREEATLCPRHLHDIAAIGGPNLPAVMAVNAGTWLSRLARFRKLMTEGRDGRRSARADLTRPSRCRACDEEATAGRRQLALLKVQLRDPVRARAYEYTHGVCLRHALAHGDALPAPARSLLDARLALLRWEVDEALRKQDWHTRHEVKGAEMTVGRRAPTLLDGRTYAGLPAPRAQTEDQSTDPHESDDAPAPATRRTQWSSK